MGDRQRLSPTAMIKLSGDCKRNSQNCTDIAKFLQDPLTTLFWRSRAATTFRGEMEGYVKTLGGLGGEFSALSDDINGRVGQLRSSQND
jgi:hypothetical protein